MAIERREGPTIVEVTVNGERHSAATEPRMLLSDFLRYELGLTGTHVGCEQGVCGACTVIVDGSPARSCLMFAVQAAGAEIETVEGLAVDGKMAPIQEAFRSEHGLQCGFCTPGFLISANAFLDEYPNPSVEEIREHMSGNVCRCTGYQGIVAAIQKAAVLRAEAQGGD
jgi:aerobic carbon-monoxide dehydrogenase small subunit